MEIVILIWFSTKKAAVRSTILRSFLIPHDGGLFFRFNTGPRALAADDFRRRADPFSPFLLASVPDLPLLAPLDE